MTLISLQTLVAKVFFNKMIGQKTINSFFTPVSKKRISQDLNEAEEDAKDPVSAFRAASVSYTI